MISADRVRPNSIVLAGLAALLILGFLFARHDRMLPVTFVEERYAFPYGPLAGAVGQSFHAPAPYLSRVTLTVDGKGIPTGGFPLNLRIRNNHGELVAESLQLVDGSGVSEQGISFSPITESEGQIFEIEIQPAEGAEGDIYLPMRAGSGLPVEVFRDLEGEPIVDWSSNFRLHQTVRPLTFVRGVLAADPLTGLGVVAALALLVGSLAAALGAVGRARGFGLGPFVAGVFGADLTLAVVWAAYALYPVA